MPLETEKTDFKLRADSLPPPKTGTIINTKFPADEATSVPQTTDSKQLEVLRFTPIEKVGIVSELSVTFSQPMIAVTSQAEANENVPVKLTPEVKGKWRWLGTKTLIFDAETRLPMATKFTVTIPAGTKSAVGGRLETAVSWTFSTTPPKVENFERKAKLLRRDEILVASFDQEINPSAVLAKISATLTGQKIPLRLATENEIKANEEISKQIQDLPKNRWLAFRPVELLPSNSSVNFSFEKGLPSAEGTLTTTEPQNFAFQTVGMLKLVKSICSWDEKLKVCPPTYPWNFEFNNVLEAKSLDKSEIKIEPKVEDFNFSIYGNRIYINAPKKPRTEYTVTISKKLKDVFGQALDQDISAKFTIGEQGASLSDTSRYNNFVTLDPNAKPTYTVYSTNHTALKVRIYSVKPEDFPAFRAFNDSEKTTYPAFGKLVFNQTIKVKNKPDEEVETEIDLSKALNRGFGHAILIVEPSIPQNRYEKIVKWFQATQIGIDAFSDYEQLTVFASNLKDGKPLSGVQFSLSNGATALSEANGMANIKLPLRKDKKQVLLYALKGEDSAILPQKEYYDYGENAERGWFSSPQKNSLRWFVFDDRKMYRPGETASIKGYLRKVTGGKASDLSELADSVSGLSYILRDSRNNEMGRGIVKLNAFGAFDLQLKIPEKANLGYQRIEFKAVTALGENTFEHNFLVQEFRRPEFEIETNIESAAPFYLGDSATISAHAKYFSGGGLANAETNWNISAEPTNYTPPNRDDFTFGKFTPWWGGYYERNWELHSREEFKGTTDVEGKHRVALDFVKANPARPYKIEAQARVQDVNRQTFTGKTSLLVHPAKLYIGLRTPKTFVQANETFKIETITTDIDGKTVSSAPVTITAELKDWQQEKGEWKEVVIDTQKCEIKSADEIVSCNFTAKKGGTYTIKSRVLDEKERPNESELTIWVAGGNRQKSFNLRAENIELIPNKKQYAPNETAEILLNAPFFPAEGVMTLERGGIVKTERFTLNSSSTVLKIPIEEAYLPNVRVGITLAGATEWNLFEDESTIKIPKSPAYATGGLNLDISTASRKLKVTAEPIDKVLQPSGQTKVNVAVTDNNGKAVANTEVALVAVDESVLALTGYKIDNPLDIFYERVETATINRHSREHISLNIAELKNRLGNKRIPVSAGVLNSNAVANAANAAANAAAYAANANTTVSRGGAIDFSLYGIRKGDIANLPDDPAELQSYLQNIADDDVIKIDTEITIDGFTRGKLPAKAVDPNSPFAMMQLRRNFAATAIFAPSVKTDANGKATVDLKLPDNLTRYRITAVAVTKSKQFGLGESNITAKQPLMVRPSAPRFMNFGDKAELPVVLQNQTDSPMSVDVVIRSNNATLTDGNGKKVTIPANDRAEIRFPVVAENAGIARFQIGAMSGKFADAAEIEFPIYTPATTEAFATYGTTEQNGAIIQPISAPKDVYKEFGGLEITASSTQLQELTDAFIYLQNYPFECSEQIASRILSVAALRDFLTAFNAQDMPSKNEIEAKMKSDIAHLQKLQHTGGGYSFWRNDDESFPFVTIHVAHALARAKAKGYAVPKEVISKILAYLKTIEAKSAKLKYSQESVWAISAYALFVRDLLGDTDLIKSKKLLKDVGVEKLSPESIGWLLSVLAKDKVSTTQVAEIKKYLLNRVTETADKAHFVNNYKDGEYVLLSSDRRADGVILEALLKSEGGNATAKERVSNTNDTLPDGRVSASDLIPKLVRGLLANRTKGRWANTQENAFVLLALDKYFQTFEKATPNFVSKIWLGNAYAGEQKFIGRTTNSSLTNIPMNYLQSQNSLQNLILDKQGVGRLYYRIGLKYAPKNLKLESADYGFEVTRTYEAIDKPEDVRRNSDGSWTIRAGSRVRVKIQMVNPSNRYHVALADYLPAGFEIINPELATSEKIEDEESEKTFYRNLSWFDHQNLRDNRAEAFRSFLNAGIWDYKYVVRATTLGNFIAPPAKAEEMYSPETFGRSATDFVRIQ